MYWFAGIKLFGEFLRTKAPGICCRFLTPESFLFVVYVCTVGPNLYLVIEVLLVPEPPDCGLSLPREPPPLTPDPALEDGLLPYQGLLPLFVMGLKVQCYCYYSYSMSLGSLSGNL